MLPDYLVEFQLKQRKLTEEGICLQTHYGSSRMG